jgi:hypothetical protein
MRKIEEYKNSKHNKRTRLNGVFRFVHNTAIKFDVKAFQTESQ